MLREAIYHRPKNNWAFAYDAAHIYLRIRTKRGDLTSVTAIYGDKYAWDQTAQRSEMHVFASDELFDYWETVVKPPFRRLRYAFELIDAEGSVAYMTEQSFLTEEPKDSLSFFDYPYINPIDLFQPPAWVKDAVFYQIFPERFANGDPSLTPASAEAWGNEPTPSNFFGGDLQGVIDHLDYLNELGINAIYFTPVFQAPSNHKYDTTDYMKVDPSFGTNDKLKELVEACHARGIRVLLDAVFNHAGGTFPPFLDLLKYGSESQYADWFHVREWPISVSEEGIPSYETFAFVASMPKLNTEHPDVKRYLLEVAQYWIEEIGIDGWRLDVANEVDHAFWREFRQTVKSVNPEAYILGEIWHDSLMWLQGDQFDAVMNYPFTNAVLDFCSYGKLDAKQFADAIGNQLAAYPLQVTETAFNLLDSHDTPRLLTISDEDERRMKLAALFQLTFPGVPCIYYGDEVGLTGGGDPGCRKCMEWDEEKQNRDLFSFYQSLIAMRMEHAALRGTGFSFLSAESGSKLLAYERQEGAERFVIVLNASEETASFTLPAAGVGACWAEQRSEGVQLKPNGTVLLDGYSYAILREQA